MKRNSSGRQEKTSNWFTKRRGEQGRPTQEKRSPFPLLFPWGHVSNPRGFSNLTNVINPAADEMPKPSFCSLLFISTAFLPFMCLFNQKDYSKQDLTKAIKPTIRDLYTIAGSPTCGPPAQEPMEHTENLKLRATNQKLNTAQIRSGLD